MIDLVIERRRRPVGGLEVGRVLPFIKRRMVGPFIFFDHLGQTDLVAANPQDIDIRPHPHIGLSTVTYLFDGKIIHRDSVGSQQEILKGEVNWMTAGSGITHSERFDGKGREDDKLHGIQTWVALPTELEEVEPSFSHHSSIDLPTFEDGGVRARLIAGEAFGHKAGVIVNSPLFYVHLDMVAGASTQLSADYSERALYVVLGSLEVDGRVYPAGLTLVFEADSPVGFTALAPTTVMLFGGETLGQRFIEWNFVSSSKARIEQAKADWRAGRMKLPDFDHDEFIPFPGDTEPTVSAPQNLREWMRPEDLSPDWKQSKSRGTRVVSRAVPNS